MDKPQNVHDLCKSAYPMRYQKWTLKSERSFPPWTKMKLVSLLDRMLLRKSIRLSWRAVGIQVSLCALKATKYTLTLVNIAFGCLIAECTQCFGAIDTLGWLSESCRFLLLTNYCVKLVRSVADFLLSRSQPSAFNFYEFSFFVFRVLPVVSAGWAFLGWWCFPLEASPRLP